MTMEIPAGQCWIMVDVEGKDGPARHKMRMFGAGVVDTGASFHGFGDTQQVAVEFRQWVDYVVARRRPVFWSDNPAFDWQWINHMFNKHDIPNPFGWSARRIGDFYAGLVGDINATSEWKSLRITPHDHNPINDCRGNVEALKRIMAGERAPGREIAIAGTSTSRTEIKEVV